MNATNICNETGNTAKIIIQNSIKYLPKVSVIVPVYNSAKYLHESMNSIINQTLREIEIICIDDGSSDDSLEILKTFAKKDPRITVLSQKNLYAGVARNFGISVARGKYLSFLDSDDFFEPNMLEEMFNCANKLKLDICVCNADIYSETEKKFIHNDRMLYNDLISKHNTIFNGEELQENIFWFTNPAVWNKLYKHDFIKKYHLKFQNLLTCNDIGMSWTAIALADKISTVNKVFVHYRLGSSTQVSSSRGKNAINIIYAYYFIKNYLIKNNKENIIPFLDSSIKINIHYELTNCNNSDKKNFYKQTKKIMKKDFKKFKICFKKDYIKKFTNLLFHKRRINNKRKIYLLGICVFSYKK